MQRESYSGRQLVAPWLPHRTLRFGGAGLLGGCLLGICLLCVGPLCPPAGAYAVSLVNGTSGPMLRWGTRNLSYYLHPACSEDIETEACLAALEDSFAQWTGHACSDISFTNLGMSDNTSTTVTPGTTNGKNELVFIEDSRWVWGSAVLGITGPVFGGDGLIAEADIIFNGLHHTWSIDGAFGDMDVMNVAVHEIGHYFGAQHVLPPYSASEPPTMAPQADPSLKSQTPEAEDVRGLCFLYPATSYTCASDDDCPFILQNVGGIESYVGVLQCEEGLCGGVSTELPQGKGDAGDLCYSSADCAAGLSCESSGGAFGGGGPSTCVQPCTNDSQCADGLVCVGGRCDDPDNPAGTPGLGQPCVGVWDCVPNVCLEADHGAWCRELCFGPGTCAEGWECDLQFFGFAGGCVPLGGGFADGAACAAPGECLSGVCSSATCTTDCDVLDGAGTCPLGSICAADAGASTAGHCLPAGGGLDGDGCGSALECASGLCSGGVCGTPCDPAARSGCPEGSECGPGDGDLGTCGPAGGPGPGGEDAADAIGGDPVADAGPGADRGSSGHGGGCAGGGVPGDTPLWMWCIGALGVWVRPLRTRNR